MIRLLQPLFALIAASSDRGLAHMVEYLKAENRVLRDNLPCRITVTPAERARLVKLGRALGGALKDSITIASPRSLARWAAGADASRAKRPLHARSVARGPPRTSASS